MTQKQMQQQAERRVHAVCRTFNEIMTGPNPLTAKEIRALIRKRPEVYGCLEAWLRK